MKQTQKKNGKRRTRRKRPIEVDGIAGEDMVVTLAPGVRLTCGRNGDTREITFTANGRSVTFQGLPTIGRIAFD